MAKSIALIGASGLAGQEISSYLSQMESADSLGFDLTITLYDHEQDESESDDLEQDLEIQDLASIDYGDFDLAIFSTSELITKEETPKALEAKCICLDCCPSLHKVTDFPVVAYDVNSKLLANKPQQLVCASSASVCLAPILDLLNSNYGLHRVVVSSYQSVSGDGGQALDELWNQSRAIFRQEEISNEYFKQQIAFNCLPQIGVFDAQGLTSHEAGLAHELRMILGCPELRVSATAVRIPVFHGEAFSVNVELSENFEIAEIGRLLESVDALELFHAHDIFPTHLSALDSGKIQVGRIRIDQSCKNGLQFWAVIDNLKTGKALNVVQTARELLS